MRVLIPILNVLFSLFVGVNYGAGHATSPGGKVVLSVVAVIALLIILGMIETFLGWIKRTLDRWMDNNTYY